MIYLNYNFNSLKNCLLKNSAPVLNFFVLPIVYYFQMLLFCVLNLKFTVMNVYVFRDLNDNLRVVYGDYFRAKSLSKPFSDIRLANGFDILDVFAERIPFVDLPLFVPVARTLATKRFINSLSNKKKTYVMFKETKNDSERIDSSVESKQSQIYASKKLARFFEVDVSIKMFGTEIFSWHFPPSK